MHWTVSFLEYYPYICLAHLILIALALWWCHRKFAVNPVKIDKEMRMRNNLVRNAMRDMEGRPYSSFFSLDPLNMDQRTDRSVLDQNAVEELAIVNMFVEKANLHLEEQVSWYSFIAWSLISVAISVLIFGFCYASNRPIDIYESIFVSFSWSYAVLDIIKTASLAGFILSMVYITVALARAYLHESAISHKQKHALRFGRLYMYTKLLHLEEKQVFEIKEKFTV